MTSPLIEYPIRKAYKTSHAQTLRRRRQFSGTWKETILTKQGAWRYYAFLSLLKSPTRCRPLRENGAPSRGGLRSIPLIPPTHCRPLQTPAVECWISMLGTDLPASGPPPV